MSEELLESALEKVRAAREIGAVVALRKPDAEAIYEAAERASELQRTFELRWAADMRAIDRWQEAHPGSELTWPDHADLVVWLLERLEQEQSS
jgi:hypothetical protein